MPQYRLGLPTPTGHPKQQKELFRTTKETLEVAQRQRGDPKKSFVRLEELTALGLADPAGSLLPGSISDTALSLKRLRVLVRFRGT